MAEPDPSELDPPGTALVPADDEATTADHTTTAANDTATAPPSRIRRVRPIGFDAPWQAGDDDLAGLRRPASARPAGVRRRPKGPPVPGFPAIVRGGWLGFVVLLVGDLVTLFAGRGSGLVLYWVAALAYALAGNRAAGPSRGSRRLAVRDGALAAAFAYVLTIPLRQADHTGLSLPVTILQIGVALAVGGLAGAIVARAHRRRGGAPATSPE